MAAYNFQPRFVDAVLSGEKTHTIRATRKRRTKVGETVHLFTGQRTKKCKLLLRGICTKVENIEMFTSRSLKGVVLWNASDAVSVTIDGQPLDRSECETLARRDGFESFAEMIRFWNGRLPFSGEIIHWTTREALEFQRLVPSARNVRFGIGTGVKR